MVQEALVKPEEKKILLIWHENEVYAVQAKCPHLGLPLIKSKIENNEIICPFHKSAFDLCVGEVKCWSPWPKLLGGVLGMVSKQKNLEVATKDKLLESYYLKKKDKIIFILKSSIQ